MGRLRNSLALRQTANVVLIVAVLATTISALEIAVAYRDERARAASTMNQLIETVSDASTRAAYHVDDIQAAAVLDGLMNFDAITFASISTDLGVVLAARRRPAEPFWAASLARWLFGDISIFRHGLAVASTGAPARGGEGAVSVGVIRLEASPEAFGRSFIALTTEVVASLLFEFVLIGAALALVFHRTLTRPLLAYVQHLDGIDPQAAQMPPAPIPRGHETDELGLVIARTNQLLEQTVAFREAEAAARDDLARSERRFRSNFEQAAVGIVNLDPDQTIVRANRRMAVMLGCEPEALNGRRFSDFIDADDRDVDAAERGALLAHEIATYTAEKRFLASQGAVMHGRITYSLAHDIDERPFEVIAVIQDVTQEKAQESRLKEQQQALMHRDKVAALGSLLAGVAHELNNPLAILMVQAQLLAETADSDDVRARAERILAPAERCARIVRSFLTLARQREVKMGRVEIDRLLDEALDLLAYQFRADDISVRRDVPDDLPTLWGDSTQLGQAFVNLLVNAQQALAERSPPREISVQVTAGNKTVSVTVADNGPGIPEGARERIFEPFFTTRGEGRGTGLGLSYCFNVMESHHGTIAAAPAPGGGTAITLTLPVRVAEEDVPRIAAERGVSQGVRVLVVDDEPELVAAMIEALARIGHHGVAAHSGAEALDIIEADPPRVIVCDLRMPGLDGPALYNEVCARDPALADAFVFVTGDMLSEDGRRFLETVNAPCITKPFQIDELRAALDAIAAS